MKGHPDYFMFIDGGNLTHDTSYMCGVKVIHVEGVHCTFETECEFIPAWNDEMSESLADTGRFFTGYNDF